MALPDVYAIAHMLSSLCWQTCGHCLSARILTRLGYTLLAVDGRQRALTGIVWLPSDMPLGYLGMDWAE